MNRSTPRNVLPRAICFKWLRSGAIDPEVGSAWPTGNGEPGPWVRASWLAMSGVVGYRVGGLPYDIDQELWVVELEEIVSAEPFPIPKELGNLDGLVDDGELRFLARRGRLLRQVPSWTPHVAQDFAIEWAIESRGRVLQALRDAEQLLEITQRNDRGRVAVEMDGPRAFIDPPPLRHAALALWNAETLTRIWRTAGADAANGGAHPTAAFGSAAALCRAAAARIYSEALHPQSSDSAGDIALHAYLAERRRQARLLERRIERDKAVHEAASGGLTGHRRAICPDLDELG